MNAITAKETRWWWVRHAPVPDGGRIYGQSDLDCDCSDTRVFAAVAREMPRDAVWVTSNLARTRQTAAAMVASMHEKPAAAPMAVTELAEQNLGAWQGLVRKDFFASRAATRHNFWFGPACERAPGGESFDDLVARVSATIVRLNEQHRGRDIIAVTHGGTIKAALALALRLEPEAALAFVIDNCSITRVDFVGGETTPYRWRVGAVNHRPWIGGVQSEPRVAASMPSG